MKTYDLIVLGGGSAGLVGAKLAKGLGKSVLLVEKRYLGGDCTWYGCVPSKTLLKAASVAKHIQDADSYGIKGSFDNADSVFGHVRDVRAGVYSGETPEVFQKEGIDVVTGEPFFKNENSIRLNDNSYTAKKFLIATGSSAFVPPITGIEDVKYLTNESVFEIKKAPESITVLGSGPIGIEMAFAFNRLGVNVNVVEKSEKILPNDDSELTEILQKTMEDEGINFYLETEVKELKKENSDIQCTVQRNGESFYISSEQLLMATGRKPNISQLNLENAGVGFDKEGIKVNKQLQTNNKNIYAAGDVVAFYKFTHLAENHAIVAVQNMFLPVKKSVNYKTLGWCTYTEPELAKTGLSAAEAKQKYGENFLTFKFPFDTLDRAVTDGTNTGLAKIFTDKSYKILGATILSERAGEITAAVQVAMDNNVPLYRLDRIIFTYPTYSQCLKYLARAAYIHKINNNFFVKLIKKFK
ncbi:MAG: mercuric reductase [Flexistipes sinusarabici]|uniref:Mercuric reductase n=1 Tax=Flexistipes sinusarabici TaxID=2352 RepID=A0A5D0MM25_FLESI|nr:FAD-dependent oxidoreductase [Flexistipes sinusarabici]TYB34046.1 MAG: mercuric reductase [Flexistipes sinusarabici]